jgi:hypothetical protein
MAETPANREKIDRFVRHRHQPAVAIEEERVGEKKGDLTL